MAVEKNKSAVANKLSDADLPVIDFSPSVLEDPDKRLSEANKLVDCFSGVGFCYITGVEARGGHPRDLLFKWMKWFFDEVSEEDKFKQLATSSFNAANRNNLRGYFPVIPGKISHHQAYDLGPAGGDKDEDEEEGNPFTEETPRLKLSGSRLGDQAREFYRIMYEQYDVLRKTAETVMSLIAEVGNERSDYFASFPFCPLLSLVKYPKRVGPAPEKAHLPDGRIMNRPAHVDSGPLTLLQTFGFPGLEIQLGDEWFAVPDREDAIVVNVGDILTSMSNGRFKSTIHRVVATEVERYSMPYFYYPAYNANINMKVPRGLLLDSDAVTDDEDKDEDEYHPFATFHLNKIPLYAEYAMLLERLPEWMKVKYLEGYKPKQFWAVKTGVETDAPARVPRHE